MEVEGEDKEPSQVGYACYSRSGLLSTQTNPRVAHTFAHFANVWGRPLLHPAIFGSLGTPWNGVNQLGG